eukprot:Rhum_TRINITY_DN10872_c0_g1::Rhum_TRINITY_DN10872_c0_g1_i1::g.40804::m.40804
MCFFVHPSWFLLLFDCLVREVVHLLGVVGGLRLPLLRPRHVLLRHLLQLRSRLRPLFLLEPRVLVPRRLLHRQEVRRLLRLLLLRRFRFRRRRRKPRSRLANRLAAELRRPAGGDSAQHVVHRLLLQVLRQQRPLLTRRHERRRRLRLLPELRRRLLRPPPQVGPVACARLVRLLVLQVAQHLFALAAACGDRVCGGGGGGSRLRLARLLPPLPRGRILLCLLRHLCVRLRVLRQRLVPPCPLRRRQRHRPPRRPRPLRARPREGREGALRVADDAARRRAVRALGPRRRGGHRRVDDGAARADARLSLRHEVEEGARVVCFLPLRGRAARRRHVPDALLALLRGCRRRGSRGFRRRRCRRCRLLLLLQHTRLRRHPRHLRGGCRRRRRCRSRRLFPLLLLRRCLLGFLRRLGLLLSRLLCLHPVIHLTHALGDLLLVLLQLRHGAVAGRGQLFLLLTLALAALLPRGLLLLALDANKVLVALAVLQDAALHRATRVLLRRSAILTLLGLRLAAGAAGAAASLCHTFFFALPKKNEPPFSRVVYWFSNEVQIL